MEQALSVEERSRLSVEAALASCRGERHEQTLRNFELLLSRRLNEMKFKVMHHAAMPGGAAPLEAETAKVARETAELLLGLARYLEGRG